MPYFLKQTKTKKGTYLKYMRAIMTMNVNMVFIKSNKKIGYVEELIKKKKIEDPIVYYKEKVT